MNRLRTIVACFVVAVWLPATSHCLLASINWASDNCCSTAENHGSSPAPEHQDCAQCANLESVGFESAAVFAFVLPPAVISLPVTNVLPAPADFSHYAPGDSSPPDLPVHWQFLTRAALPARTPAIVS